MKLAIPYMYIVHAINFSRKNWVYVGAKILKPSVFVPAFGLFAFGVFGGFLPPAEKNFSRFFLTRRAMSTKGKNTKKIGTQGGGKYNIFHEWGL